MKKLFYLSGAALVALTMAAACGNNSKSGEAAEQANEPETFTVPITNTTGNATVRRSFHATLGTGTFQIFESDTDSVDYTLQIPANAENTEPVTSVSMVSFIVWFTTPDGKEGTLCKGLPLSEDQLPKVLEMAKAAVPTDTVMYTIKGRMPKSMVDSVRTAKSLAISASTYDE